MTGFYCRLRLVVWGIMMKWLETLAWWIGKWSLEIQLNWLLICKRGTRTCVHNISTCIYMIIWMCSVCYQLIWIDHLHTSLYFHWVTRCPVVEIFEAQGSTVWLWHLPTHRWGNPAFVRMVMGITRKSRNEKCFASIDMVPNHVSCALLFLQSWISGKSDVARQLLPLTIRSCSTEPWQWWSEEGYFKKKGIYDTYIYIYIYTYICI